MVEPLVRNGRRTDLSKSGFVFEVTVTVTCPFDLGTTLGATSIIKEDLLLTTADAICCLYSLCADDIFTSY